ncbi:hypothetical protein [Denitrobaculum tricleocarpae]|uniref:Uncharacterized protein n=1 Tax=Denitrobaculum tricleocarpae TaxID=2591009 RepID=A0A545U2J7_9PROT|nr:hypothetical protein [Denitrobaculum tricleocarpae]TQV83633.1 hypothetical protein FKG95_03310 [Denitrobaculum tricleocarpae]
MTRYKSLLVTLAVCQAVTGGVMYAMPELFVLRLDFRADQVVEIERNVRWVILLLALFTFLILKMETPRQKRWTHLALGALWLAVVVISIIEVNFGYVELSNLFWFLSGAFCLSHTLLATSLKN